MNLTDNFELKLYEGSDKFNPLLVENDNTEKLDEILSGMQMNVIEPATEIKSGSIHAITRSKGESAVFRFTASANWTAGDTMTVDDTQVSVFLTSGEALGTGAYVIGTEVIGAIVGTRVTIYCVAGVVEEAQNALKLEGHPAEYFGTAEDVSDANALAQAANTIAQAAQTTANQVSEDLAETKKSGFGNYIDISAHTTFANAFVCPNDGYVYLSSNSNQNARAFVYGANATKDSDTAVGIDASAGLLYAQMFVKKGMKVIVYSTNRFSRYVALE